MNYLKTIAVEDEAPALRRLVKMIEKHTKLHLAETAKTAAEAKDKILKMNPDLLLLDIQLKDATAFDLLSEIENNFTGKIIFITAYDQYAVKAFDFEAVDYLLKPYTQERFNTAVNRAISKTRKPDLKEVITLLKTYEMSSPKMLIIPEGTKNHFIEKEKLQYIIAEGYYTKQILTDGKKLIRISLKKLEELLPDNFIRINKSIIINIDFIVELYNHKSTAKVVMADKNEFYISENFLKDFRRRVL